MSIEGIKAKISRYAPIEKPDSIIKPDVITSTKGKPDFADMFNKAVKEVDSMQNQADQQIEGLTLKRGRSNDAWRDVST